MRTAGCERCRRARDRLQGRLRGPALQDRDVADRGGASKGVGAVGAPHCASCRLPRGHPGVRERVPRGSAPQPRPRTRSPAPRPRLWAGLGSSLPECKRVNISKRNFSKSDRMARNHEMTSHENKVAEQQRCDFFDFFDFFDSRVCTRGGQKTEWKEGRDRPPDPPLPAGQVAGSGPS